MKRKRNKTATFAIQKGGFTFRSKLVEGESLMIVYAARNIKAKSSTVHHLDIQQTRRSGKVNGGNVWDCLPLSGVKNRLRISPWAGIAG
jgi:hypothetical protein